MDPRRRSPTAASWRSRSFFWASNWGKESFIMVSFLSYSNAKTFATKFHRRRTLMSRTRAAPALTESPDADSMYRMA